MYPCRKCQHRHQLSSGIGRRHIIYRADLFQIFGRKIASASRHVGRRIDRSRDRRRAAKAARPPSVKRRPREEEAIVPAPRHPVEHPPPPRPWPTSPERRRRELHAARKIASAHLRTAASRVEPALIIYVFDEENFWEKTADKIIEALPHGRRDRKCHWICEQLTTAAKVVDSGTYEKIVGETLELGLTKIGVPDFIATAIDTGARIGIKAAFDASTFSNLSKAFSALIPLVCHNLNHCPEEAEVLKTYATPLIAKDLKMVAETLGAPQRT